MQSSAARSLAGCRSAFRNPIRVTTRRRAFQTLTASQTWPAQNSRLSTGPPRTRSVQCFIPPKARKYSSQTTDVVFPDPNRPDLFYHLVHAPTPVSPTLPAFALSFLHERPPAADSASIIGWLPAQVDASDAPDGQAAEQASALQDFRENPAFLKILHETIKEGLQADVDEQWIDKATALQSGWMHIHDQRNIPALDRIGDPDDIIATVLVQDGKMLVETYSPMPAYRVCTADGVIQLTEGLSAYLQKKLGDLNNL